MILVAATLSHELLSAARQHVLALKKVTSKDLHRVLPHVEQVFLAVEAQEKAGVCAPAHWLSPKAAIGPNPNPNTALRPAPKYSVEKGTKANYGVL